METLEKTKISELNPKHAQSAFMFDFSDWIIEKLDLKVEQLSKLPPTDGRFRTDRRSYEYGDVKMAADEKHRLEELQRARRKERKRTDYTHVPRWFKEKEHPETGEMYYEYLGGYFEAKEDGQWSEHNKGSPFLDYFNDP